MSRSKFVGFIASRNINQVRGRRFRAYLHINPGRQEFGLDPISAASDPPGRQINSSTLVNANLSLTTSSSGDVLGTLTRAASIASSSTMPVITPSTGL